MKPTVIDVLENALYHFSNPDEPGRLSNYICNHITSENNPFYYSITNGDVTFSAYKAQQLLHKYRPTPELFPEIYNHEAFIRIASFTAFWNGRSTNDETAGMVSIYNSAYMKDVVFPQKIKYLELLIAKLESELDNTII